MSIVEDFVLFSIFCWTSSTLEKKLHEMLKKKLQKNLLVLQFSCPQGTSATQSVTASFVTVTWTAAEHLQRTQVKLAKKRDLINKFKILTAGFWELRMERSGWRLIKWDSSLSFPKMSRPHSKKPRGFES